MRGNKEADFSEALHWSSEFIDTPTHTCGCQHPCLQN